MVLRAAFNIIISIYFILLVSACSPLQILNVAVNDEDYKSILNQSYGPAARQKLNIFVPNTVQDKTDVIVFYYGGRWQSGQKEHYEFVADALTAKGFVTVLPDYRLYPDVDWPDFIQDGAEAYQWVYKNIANYHGNPKRIFVMGHSSGAYIAAMVSLKESLLEDNVGRPCGFIGLAGPYDFLPIEDADVQQVFSSASNQRDTQPITYVNKGDPGMLLLHGKDDTTVKPGNSTRLARQAKLFDTKAETILYDGVGHVGILISLSSLFRGYSPAFDDSLGFIRQLDC